MTPEMTEGGLVAALVQGERDGKSVQAAVAVFGVRAGVAACSLSH